jgi:NCS1 family nucleobase:cation symporter-1|uniref:Pentacotripeptide-repeat region of PRORP domain-containing protein n=1 Tax=Fagus sylvatica TaxID=28930 RepID=A0A2N9J2I9_FAGSY
MALSRTTIKLRSSQAFILAFSNNIPSSQSRFPLSFFKRLILLSFIHSLPPSARNTSIFPNPNTNTITLSSYYGNRQERLFTSKPTSSKVNTKVNFSLPDSDDEDDIDTEKEIDKRSNLPPPYDPFNNKPVIEEPNDPKNLQEIFHNLSKDGLFNNAVKMFDALSKDGLTHEALELFAQIKDKGHMPDVVAHTAVIETYANAGLSKECLKVYLRMLASGVTPNAYTYTVLIKGLAADPKYIGDAKKYVMEMMGKGMRPNARTYTTVFEALTKEQKLDEAKEFLEQMKSKGFVPDEGGS